MPMPCLMRRRGEEALDSRILCLIATVIDCCGGPQRRGRGRPPTETIQVLAALRRFLREGTPWRGLVATEAQASGPHCAGGWRAGDKAACWRACTPCWSACCAATPT